MNETVGRNDPCPCGSGKKFKKCCGTQASPANMAAAEIQNQLGNQAGQHEQYKVALAHFQKASVLAPRVAAFHSNLGLTLFILQRYAEAKLALQEALVCDSRFIPAHTNLSAVLLLLGDNEGSIFHSRKTLDSEPSNAQAHRNLGIALHATQQYSDALTHMLRCQELDPHGAVSLINNILITYEELRDFTHAHPLACKVLAAPEKYHTALASALTIFSITCDFVRQEQLLHHVLQLARMGKLDTAVLDPILLATNYSLYLTNSEIFELHTITTRQLEKQANPLVAKKHTLNNLHGSRRIKIGYLSPDFRRHAVAKFIAPVIAHHDRSRFESFCYALNKKEDNITKQIQKSADVFRMVAGMTTHQIAEQIQLDGIDILIDLAGYTNRHRIEVFTYKPAPVQITYLGYPNTTGLSNVDYRITDPYADTTDGTIYTEKLLPLPESFLTFGSFEATPCQPTPPAQAAGVITFGSFNNLQKISAETIRVWSALLKQTANSQLVIKTKYVDNDLVQTNLLDAFLQHGVFSNRISLIGWAASENEHLRYYDKIDIALDTFPYGGTTTTCEALWMGVPVLTLVGKRHSQRVGYSILKNIGVEDTISHTEEEFVDIGKRLANDFDTLTDLRKRVASGIRKSILCNPEKFTRQFEDALTIAFQNSAARI